MHTTKLLRSEDFIFEINEKKSRLEDVFTNFTEKDRLGIVVGKPGGSIGASVLYMAAITKYYDHFRPLLGNEQNKLRIYPDYFIFHIGKRHMDHYWMDIWPHHKEVVINENNPEKILQAINDRGITRLIVEDNQTTSPTFLRETVSSAKQRIVTALAYAPSGKVQNHDIRVTGPKIVEDLVKASLKRSDGLFELMYQEFRDPTILDQKGCATESFRRITLEEAINKLSPFL
jgi:hypothetical protein